MKALSDTLYFKNPDNDAGVFHHLIDAAAGNVLRTDYFKG